MTVKIDKSLDQIFEEFDAETTLPQSGERKPITIWVPTEYKNTYDEIQAKTQHKLSKVLKKVVMKSIELAEAEVST